MRQLPGITTTRFCGLHLITVSSLFAYPRFYETTATNVCNVKMRSDRQFSPFSTKMSIVCPQSKCTNAFGNKNKKKRTKRDSKGIILKF